MFKRHERHVGDSITLSLHYNGVARHVPEAVYVGGSVCKYDYVLPKEINIETLNLFCDSVGLGKGMVSYTIGYYKGDGSQGDEGVERGDERDEGIDGDELIDGDYEQNEDDNEGQCDEGGRVEGQNARNLMDSSKSSEDEENDVVDNDGDLDEKRDLDNGEDGGPSHPLFNAEEIYDPTFEIGMMFNNKQEFKKALQSHAIKTKRILKFTKNDKQRVYVECGNADYQWRLHAIKIRRTNPGTTVVVGTEDNMRETRFSRFYVCFGALKRGFKAGCRPIVGIDGCHLKEPHGGILLTAIGVDPNNNLFPIAYAVVDKECRRLGSGF
ncbi:UNVERIFIED_CONTAM: hypothetical protein Sradi_4845500 [Sesamum radiatum]|uniref:Transposase MuDR plant domain-containing protein n=1 Tax=Sesamum radiatum TaxID=300843 RepID=A0AAW2N0Y3_SESRA